MNRPGDGGPLGLLTDKEILLARRAFASLRAGIGARLATGEELLSPNPGAVARALRELGASPQQAARILGVWAFSWRDPATGVVVLAVFAHRRAACSGSVCGRRCSITSAARSEAGSPARTSTTITPGT